LRADGGEVVKVKYGRNAEIHAELAGVHFQAISRTGHSIDHGVIEDEDE